MIVRGGSVNIRHTSGAVTQCEVWNFGFKARFGFRKEVAVETVLLSATLVACHLDPDVFQRSSCHDIRIVGAEYVVLTIEEAGQPFVSAEAELLDFA